MMPRLNTDYAKNYCNRTLIVKVIVIVENVVTCFLWDTVYTVGQKNWATCIFTVTLANVGRFLKFFQCRNQKEMAHNKNEKFPTVA